MLAVAQQQTFHYPDMDFELDGATLHYERRGDGRPLLLLHGGTGVADDWKHVFPEPPAGFELIAPDLRGHGRSGNPKGAFTIGQIADDVLALLEHLSIGRCDAIGMSLGAKALLHAASKRPEVIGAMVLVSGAAYFPESARRIMAQMSPDAYDDEQLDAMREKHVLGDEQIFALWRQMHAFKDSYTDLNFTPPLLARIKARTLIVHGDRDPLYPLSMAVELYESIPDAQLWVVPGGGHVPVFGSIGPEFVRLATEFLAPAVER